jgi:hypothetical protein
MRGILQRGKANRYGQYEVGTGQREGRGAGTRTAGALWGPFPRAALEIARPDALLNVQQDVLGLLENA